MMKKPAHRPSRRPAIALLCLCDNKKMSRDNAKKGVPAVVLRALPLSRGTKKGCSGGHPFLTIAYNTIYSLILTFFSTTTSPLYEPHSEQTLCGMT
jgi:hypothetical protein